tara:strand:+ start:142 stop:732 length:591 start_codon:yes stop_codon:yes gene_type:complete
MISKRIFDIFFLIITLPIFSILFIIVMSLNIIFNGFPIFFYQERVGYKNKIFTIYKFRTMPNNIDFNEKIDSLSTWNKILRSSSLDEIPELINIFKGEMSFVGPRPLLVEYLKIYNKKNIQRHNVLPGITGLSQINGRNTISWKKKFEYDIYYVKNRNFFLDIKIIFITFIKIFAFKEINYSDKLSMEKFTEESEQ